jgi:hypothetical protein
MYMCSDKPVPFYNEAYMEVPVAVTGYAGASFEVLRRLIPA